MTVYITCDECGWDTPEDEISAHVCEDELDGYDPLEPWMDNE
jgi:hypothetical protein